MKQIMFLVLFNLFAQVFGQSFTSWVTGDTADQVAVPHGGIVLAGGGGDNDDAMSWFLQQAAGGDVLILRASGSDGYNNYLYSQLGVTVNSVETIRFNQATAAQDPYVIRRIREAEALFLAGGDQYDYYQYWKDNDVEDAINYLLRSKHAVVGGTSAGMAVLGEAYYTPVSYGVDSAEALGNPYHPYMTVLGQGDFIDAPFLGRTITDTHFDQRDRAGRTVAFLARLETDFGMDAQAIACNEYTAVAVDTNGIAHVYGDPQYNDFAYFVQSNCDQPGSLPDSCLAGQPLHWDQNGEALKVYRILGNANGSNTFSLVDWRTGQGGDWLHWSVDQGQLVRAVGNDTFCVTVGREPISSISSKVGPNPFSNVLFVELLPFQGELARLELLDVMGKSLWQEVLEANGRHRLDLPGIPNGVYWFRASTEKGKTWSQKLVRQN